MGAGRRLVDATLAAGILIAVVFPFAARIAALDPDGALPRLTTISADQLRLPPVAQDPAGDLRGLPVFEEGGAADTALDAGAAAGPGAIESALLSAGSLTLGADPAAALVALARNSETFLAFEVLTPSGRTLSDVINDPRVAADAATPAYPFRFGPVEALIGTLPPGLDGSQAAAVSDLGGLFALAAGSFTGDFTNAGSIAFALLDRARADGECASQLNLAVVVMADTPPSEEHALEELAEAERRCGPDDPTARWLRGQFLAQRSEALVIQGGSQAEVDAESADLHRRAHEAFAELQTSLPGSPTGWAGAGDAELLLAYRNQFVSPFEARRHFRRALTYLERADEVSDDPDVDLGLARAHAGLADHEAAVADLRRAVDAAPERAVYILRLAEQLERTHDFAAAAEAVVPVLEGDAALPDGRTIQPVHQVLNEAIAREDGPGPLTLRAATDRPASFLVGALGGAGAGGLSDLSFLPEFRSVQGVTGHDRWCPAWTRARDLVLSGEAEEVAQEGAIPPDGYVDIRPWQSGLTCLGAATASASELLRAVAAAEAGIEVGSAEFSDSDVFEARQDMWRFAGDLERAAAVTEEWQQELPDDSLAHDRAGEIAFLADDLSAAEEHFESAAALAEEELARAEALLKLGTVRELAGDLRAAQPPLREADEIATDMIESFEESIEESFEEESFDESFDDETFEESFADESFENDPALIDVSAFAYVSYNARTQLGDTALRGRDYEEAAREYARAHEQEPDLPTSAVSPVTRPEVLDNNEALVLIHLKRPAEGLKAARSAVSHDPANPIFLENEAFALRRLGRLDDAAAVLERALASDPKLFTAANDLAVIRSRQGRDEEAVALLRAAVAAEGSYALGLFNLGVALDRAGPGHLLEAQGSLGRAIALDDGLRNAERVPTFDDEPFFTTLDLSKPLPRDWTFATSNRRTSAVLAGAVTVLLLLRLGGASLGEIASDQFQERTLARGERRPRRRFPSWIAIGVTVAAFLYPLARSKGSSLSDYALLAIGTAFLVGLYLRARQIARARYPVVVAEYTWGPSVVIGAITTAVGLGYAPLPVAEEQGSDPVARIHAVGPAVLAFMSALLFALSAITDVPFARALGAAALVMTASVLAPVRPLDGAVVARGRRALLLDALMVALAILFALGVL